MIGMHKIRLFYSSTMVLFLALSKDIVHFVLMVVYIGGTDSPYMISLNYLSVIFRMPVYYVEKFLHENVI